MESVTLHDAAKQLAKNLAKIPPSPERAQQRLNMIRIAETEYIREKNEQEPSPEMQQEQWRLVEEAAKFCESHTV